jgi:hypothetical protein
MYSRSYGLGFTHTRDLSIDGLLAEIHCMRNRSWLTAGWLQNFACSLQADWLMWPDKSISVSCLLADQIRISRDLLVEDQPGVT